MISFPESSGGVRTALSPQGFEVHCSSLTSLMPRGLLDRTTCLQRAQDAKLSELGSVTSPVTTGEFGSDIQIAAGLLTSFDPDARKDIIKNAVPGVTFEEVNDTTVVNLPNGQRAVLNAPGLSQSDLITGIGQALSFVPAGLISSIPRHLAQRIGLGAVTSGATEAGLQATSQALGSEQAIDKGQVATAAALGGAGEVVVPALKGLKDAASKSIKNLENTGRSALESSDLALQIQSKQQQDLSSTEIKQL